MSKPLELLMKKHFKFPCFGSTLEVCIVLIVLTLATSLACYGGGGGGDGPQDPDEEPLELDPELIELLNATTHTTLHNKTTGNHLDDPLVIDLKGIKVPLDRNVETAWHGWKPPKTTLNEWTEWNNKYLTENSKNGEEIPWKKQKKGDPEYGPFVPGQPGGPDFSAERGPESGWPNLPGWADLGPGNKGSPIPPWAYAPKNIGKPTLCYLPPVLGECRGIKNKPQPVDRWGFNPYVNECQKYQWSKCGGTRNKFTTKEACEKLCKEVPPPSCSADSGIPAKKNPKLDDVP